MPAGHGFNNSPSALGSPWFIPRQADAFVCSLQQLSLQWSRRFRTFCCLACVTIHVLARSPHRWRCIRADVQSSTQPRSTSTPFAVCTGTSGLRSQSATQLPSVAFTSHSRWFVRIAPQSDCHQSLLIFFVYYSQHLLLFFMVHGW